MPDAEDDWSETRLKKQREEMERRMSHFLTVPAPPVRKLESGERLRSGSFFFSERVSAGDESIRRKPSVVKFSLEEKKPHRGPEHLLEEDEELIHHRP
ncbi:Na(+)/H(+) exchanger beta-like [Puntigrus tetrazona]|nr:Na(+)/H(+) exchanger beta-like [Puntigrus tetrazona]